MNGVLRVLVETAGTSCGKILGTRPATRQLDTSTVHLGWPNDENHTREK